MEQKRKYKCPVKEGEIISGIECEGIGKDGDGIFKIEGFVIFVPGTEIDKIYTIKIKTVRNKIAFGEINSGFSQPDA